jgi:DNA-binding FadR family transcriptional regulator
MIVTDAQTIAGRNRGSLASQVATSLERMIKQGEFQVGDKLPTESALGSMYDVSRTVVREAVSHLKSAGLVETRRGVGAFIIRRDTDMAFMLKGLSRRTAQEIINILEFRIAIESEAASLAARRRTDADLAALEANLERFKEGIGGSELVKQEDFEFHRLIGQACHNPVYDRFYEFFGLSMVPRSHVADLGAREDMSKYLNRVLGEHRAIYAQIRAEDSQASREAVRRHLERSYRLYKRSAGADTDT